MTVSLNKQSFSFFIIKHAQLNISPITLNSIRYDLAFIVMVFMASHLKISRPIGVLLAVSWICLRLQFGAVHVTFKNLPKA